MSAPQVTLSQVTQLFGSGGANIPPNGAGGTPSIRDVLQSLLARQAPPTASATTLEAVTAPDRADGQLVVKLDDYTLWVYEIGSSAGASGTVIVPNDGVGRWIKKI